MRTESGSNEGLPSRLGYRWDSVVLSAVLLGALPIYAWRMDEPFLRHWEIDAAWCGTYARSYLKFGYSTLGWYQSDVSGPSLEAYENLPVHVRSNHPPLIFLLISLSLKLFGVHEWSVRLVPILLSLGCVTFLHRIARRMLGNGAVLASVAFAFNPMIAYFSVAMVWPVVTLFWILGGVWAYLRWVEKPTKARFLLVALFQLAACYSDWHGYFLGLAICGHLLISNRSKWKWAVLVLAINVLAFGLLLGHLYLLDPVEKTPLRFLFARGANRTSWAGLSVPEYLCSEAREIALYFTVGGGLLALIGLFRFPRSSIESLLPWLLLLGSYEVIFPVLASAHDNYSYLLAPCFALAAGAGARTVWSCASRWRKPLLGILVLAFVLQSGTVLYRRLSRRDPLPLHYRLGMALHRATAPSDRILVVALNRSPLTTFYSDRRILWYDRAYHTLAEEMHAPPVKERVTDRDMVEYLIQNERKFVWVVAADWEHTLPMLNADVRKEDPRVRFLGIELEKSDLTAYLEEHAGPPRIVDGFLFWPLRPYDSGK